MRMITQHKADKNEKNTEARRHGGSSSLPIAAPPALSALGHRNVLAISSSDHVGGDMRQHLKTSVPPCLRVQSTRSGSFLGRGTDCAKPPSVRVQSGLAAIAIAVALSATGPAGAQQVPAAANEGALGTVEVTGSAGIVLPKLAVVPIAEDAEARDILKKDLDRIGLYDVVEDAALPAGPFGKDDAFDSKTWKAKGLTFVVRVHREGDNLIGEAWLLNKGELSKGDDTVAKPSVAIGPGGVRRAAHEVADRILSTLTGRAGPFASRLAYAMRTGKGRQIAQTDVDGQNKTTLGSPNDTALSPVFGPAGDVYFTISKSYDPFHLAKGKDAAEIALPIPGSVLSVSFSPDQTKLAVSIMSEQSSRIYVGKSDGTGLAPFSTGDAKLPNRPVLGPLGKTAYVATPQFGGPQRVYVDGNAISPAGFHASSPTFCDSPQGLLVVFAVGVGNGADLIATDTSGGNLRRLTQGQGSNAYPACSPDGRLVAFFSTGAGGKAPGLYALPLSYATRIRKLADDHGESLAWAR